MGFFGGKDWNIVAVLFEKADLYRVNGNRGKGGEAVTMRDNVKNFPRTIYWAVFDQKRGFLEGAPGPGAGIVPAAVLKQLIRDLPMNATVQSILATLEAGKELKLSKGLEWNGYPLPESLRQKS
jgi:hypothetical protein